MKYTMKWFKFYGNEYLIDPKILSLSPAERSCWITLLCYASNNDNADDNASDNGVIRYLDEDKLMIQAGLDMQREEWEETKGILKKLSKLKMIRLDNGVITIKNWLKRQEMNLTSYERVKRWREKKRLDNAPDNAMITVEESRVDKSRVDNNILKKEITTKERKKNLEELKKLRTSLKEKMIIK